MPGTPAYRLYQWFWTTVDLVFPPSCGGCGKFGRRWCDDCLNEVHQVSPPICEICGTPAYRSGVCERCRVQPPHYRAIRSWGVFGGPLRQAIHRMKYQHDVGLGEVLARPLTSLLRKLDWEFDTVLPVPLGVARRRERGYNQAALLARPIALELGVSYLPRALDRVKETRSQVGLNLSQRRENVRDAFRAQSGKVTGKGILVIDDVTTSGSTLEACAVALSSAGAGRVYGLTLARADHRVGVSEYNI